jgi:hypothetical protein
MTPNFPKMDLNKYGQYISKTLTAGTEGKSEVDKAQIVLKNMSHNMKVFISQVHTYFNEKTKTGERKWVTNERVVKSINKKLAKLEKKIDDADKTPAKKEFFLRETIAETKKIIKTFEKAGVSDKEIQSLQDHVKTLDAKWKELKDKPLVIALKEREPVAKEIGQTPEKPQEKGLVHLKAAGLAEEKKESIAKKEQEQPDAEVLNPLEEKNLHSKKPVEKTEEPQVQPSKGDVPRGKASGMPETQDVRRATQEGKESSTKKDLDDMNQALNNLLGAARRKYNLTDAIGSEKKEMVLEYTKKLSDLKDENDVELRKTETKHAARYLYKLIVTELKEQFIIDEKGGTEAEDKEIADLARKYQDLYSKVYNKRTLV